MKKVLKRFVKNERGASEVTQSLLLSGVAIVLVLVLFFPTIRDFVGTVSVDLESWYMEKSAEMFEIKG